MSDSAEPDSGIGLPDESGLPLVDDEVLRERANDLEEDQVGGPLLTSVVTTFIEDARAMVPRLRRKVEMGDLEAVEGTAHRLKGGGATVGAEAFTEWCRAIEQAARQERWEDVQEGISQLPTVLDRTVRRYRDVIGPLSLD